MLRLLILFAVWLGRIPARFSLLFAVMLSVYLFILSELLARFKVSDLAQYLKGWLRSSGVPDLVTEWLIVGVLLEGIIIAVFFVFGFLVSYNLAAWGYRYWRRKPAAIEFVLGENAKGASNRLQKFDRIGIILAGGGAKGVYQAGALKAIHEFLEENNALDKVGMIAGTSIGAWNAMFWLAGLVKPPSADGISAHEQWWKSISIGQIAEFAHYWPLTGNHFLRTTPWRETFHQIFFDERVKSRLADLFPSPDSGASPRLNFYFTRSNVRMGELCFATNWPGILNSQPKYLRRLDSNAVEMVKVAPGNFELIEGGDLANALVKVERAVFASMDLPPLFPYVSVRAARNEWFEDGGVIDNVPVWFGTTVEHCDLLFILPLNSSFAEDVNHTSVVKRLFRVMDVRQGVLERNSMKLTYLYNELAALRAEIERLRKDADGAPERETNAGKADLVTRALNRKNKPVSVFSICPDKPLLVDTAEFWKRAEAEDAFDTMYQATERELDRNFERNTDPNWLRMTLVDRQGNPREFEDF